jgi:putative tricarboxylic transport membrane protein
MLGGIITGKPPVSLSQATPLARITSEYNVFVLPAESKLKTMKDVIEQMKRDPGSVKWGGGSRGSTEHIAAAMIAREVGVDPAKINYVAFRGGGEAIAAILGGNVTVGGSGYSEFAEYIGSGKMRPIAVTSDARLKGKDTPTLKEMGINVVIGNWRGVYGAPGITPEQRKGLIEMIVKATKTKAWAESLEKNGWTPAMLTGAEFEKFVDDEFASLRAVMVKSGMVLIEVDPDAGGRRRARHRRIVRRGRDDDQSGRRLCRCRAELPALGRGPGTAGVRRVPDLRGAQRRLSRDGGALGRRRRPLAGLRVGVGRHPRQCGADHNDRLHPELRAVLCARGARLQVG